MIENNAPIWSFTAISNLQATRINFRKLTHNLVIRKRAAHIVRMIHVKMVAGARVVGLTKLGVSPHGRYGLWNSTNIDA